MLQQVYPYLRLHKRVIVLGDAEFSNQPVISWLLNQQWGFVFRFQHRYLLQLSPRGPWQAAKRVYEALNLQPGQVQHLQPTAYTQQHQMAGLTVTLVWDADEAEPLCAEEL